MFCGPPQVGKSRKCSISKDRGWIAQPARERRGRKSLHSKRMRTRRTPACVTPTTPECARALGRHRVGDRSAGVYPAATEPLPRSWTDRSAAGAKVECRPPKAGAAEAGCLEATAEEG
eukprot:Rmarinus@m.7159